MSNAPPPGVYVPAVLFFKDDELDIPAIEAHILRLAHGGVTGILVQGSNGEAQHLSHEERALVIKTTRQTLDSNGFKHVVLMAGTGASSTKETKLLCEEAKDAGAGFVLVLTPGVWPPQMSKDNIIKFHREVRIDLVPFAAHVSQYRV
jgi:4-hydroxy-2-oxoglutarate aldolase